MTLQNGFQEFFSSDGKGADGSTLFVVFLSNYKIVFISNYNILFISNYKIVFLSPCNFVEWHSNDIPRTINNKEVEVWQVWKQKYQNRRSLHTCVGQNPQNWNLLELFILRILVGWIPQISCLVDRAYWHFIQAWDVLWILHIHIPYTWLRIRLSSQTAKNIKNMKRLLLFRSIQLLQQSMNWINVQPDLRFQSRLFLEITGKGKSCYAVPHGVMNLFGGQILSTKKIAKDIYEFHELLDFVFTKNLIKKVKRQRFFLLSLKKQAPAIWTNTYSNLDKYIW